MAESVWSGTRALAQGILAVCLGLAFAGCAKARAATEPEIPTLDAPPAPPRIVAPQAVDTAPAPAPVTAGDESPAPTSPRPAAVRTEPAKPAPAVRTDREPDREPAKPEEPRPTRTLQTPTSAGESERAVRDHLARASAELQRVDYRALSASLKEQYDQAKRFIQQTEDALKTKNLVYAATLAGKALEIAEVLPRR